MKKESAVTALELHHLPTWFLFVYLADLLRFLISVVVENGNHFLTAARRHGPHGLYTKLIWQFDGSEVFCSSKLITIVVTSTLSSTLKSKI